VVMLLTGALWSFAQNERPPETPLQKEAPALQGKHRLLNKLPDLTEDQKAELKSLHLKLMEETLPLQNEIGEKEASLRSLTTAEEVDLEAVNKTIDEIAAAKAELMKKRVATEQAVRNVLNEEQRIIFDHHRLEQKHRKGHPPKGPHQGH